MANRFQQNRENSAGQKSLKERATEQDSQRRGIIVEPKVESVKKSKFKINSRPNKEDVKSLFKSATKREAVVAPPEWTVLEPIRKKDIAEIEEESIVNKITKSAERVIRRVIKSDTTLDKVDFFNKFILAKRYQDKESGKQERELQEKERKEIEREQQLQASLKKFLIDTLYAELDQKFAQVGSVMLQIDKKFDEVVYQVLSGREFVGYDFEEIPRNRNHLALGMDVPRRFVFNVKEV